MCLSSHWQLRWRLKFCSFFRILSVRSGCNIGNRLHIVQKSTDSHLWSGLSLSSHHPTFSHFWFLLHIPQYRSKLFCWFNSNLNVGFVGGVWNSHPHFLLWTFPFRTVTWIFIQVFYSHIYQLLQGLTVSYLFVSYICDSGQICILTVGIQLSRFKNAINSHGYHTVYAIYIQYILFIVM